MRRTLGLIFLQPPEATNKGSGFNRGAGGGARRCGVEERAAAYAHTEGDIPYSSRCLSVWCVCGHLIDRWFSRQIILKIAREGLGGGCVGRREGREREGAYLTHRHIPASERTLNTHACHPTPALRWHVIDEHLKDTAQDVAEDANQDVAEDVTQDVAEDVLVVGHREGREGKGACLVHRYLPAAADFIEAFPYG